LFYIRIVDENKFPVLAVIGRGSELQSLKEDIQMFRWNGSIC
jgi:hypothetical protein